MSIDLNLINQGNLKPREEVRIEDLRADPYPDGRRIKVMLRITPFRERPNLEVSLHDAENRRVAGASIIETMTFTMNLTLHLRELTQTGGSYSVCAVLYYEDLAAPQDQREVAFTIAPPTD